MPTYTLPQFNVGTSVWTPPHNPAGNPPDFTGVLVQWYVYSRTPTMLFHPGSGRWLPMIILRIPYAFAVTIVPDWIFGIAGSLPQGPHYVKVQYKQLMHAGFPNTYYALFCLQCNANGSIPLVPLPTP